MEVIGQLHAPTALLPGKYPSDTYQIGGCLGPRAGLEAVMKKMPSMPLPGVEARS
jgi:hypothetical protein